MTVGVLVPIDVTDAILTSTTAPETDYAEYDPAKTYVLGERCISSVTHRIYESLVGGNLAHDPTDLDNQFGTTRWWLDADPTNAWAMFDSEVSTQTVLASPLTIVLEPGFFNGIAMFGLDAEHLVITIKDAPGGNVIYSYDDDLENSAPGDWYEHFFSPFKPQTDFFASGIDQYHDAEITLTLTSASAPVKCGMLALGDLRPIGRTMYGGKAKPKTYSYIKTDEYGKTIIKRRKATKDISITGWLEVEEADTVLDTLTELLDVPCAVIGSDLANHAGLRTFGLISGEISYDHPRDCLLTMNVQGMI